MFAAFFEKRRVRGVLDRIVASLPARLADLSQTERAATLAVSNAVLIAVAEDTGLPLATTPTQVPEATAIRLVDLLAQERAKVVDGIQASGDIVSPEALGQAARETFAYDLVALTAAAGFRPDVRALVVRVWTELVASSASAKRALDLLSSFAKSAGAVPLPPRKGRKWTSEDVMRLASVAPPFLRSAKSAKGRDAA